MAKQNTPDLPTNLTFREKNQHLFAKLATVNYKAVGSNKSMSYSEFDKATFRTYMQNPKNNEKNLRNMSRFFYRASANYKRLVDYFAKIPLLYWNLSPRVDLNQRFSSTAKSTKEQSNETIIKKYYDMLVTLTNMNMEHEFRKIMLIAFREDVFYGYCYSTKESFFIDQMDPDYCRIVSVEDGVFNYEFDFSYYDSNPAQVETLAPALAAQYNAYLRDKTNMKWQLIDPKEAICIKVNEDSPMEVIPPLVGIFEDLIDLIDYKSLVRNREEIYNYKLLVEHIPVRSDSNSTDDFTIDLDTAVAFHERTSEAVPEQVGVVVSPMKIDSIEFKRDTTEVDLIAQAVRNLFDNSGVSAMLFNSDKSGKVGLEASIRTDEMVSFALLRQLERWVRRYLKYHSTGTKFEFRFLDISEFNKDNYTNMELALANAGMPNKLTIMASRGVNPLTALSEMVFENEILNLPDNLIPLQSAHTQSSNDPNNQGGRPAMNESDLSDSGMQSRDDGNNIDTIET